MLMNLKHGIPEPWATALMDAGFISPWDTPSMNRLSEETGIHVSTISRIIKGQNTKGPTKEVMDVLAKALRKPVREVGSWANAAWADLEPYKAPQVADLMTPDQRAAVDSIIRAFAAANRQTRQEERRTHDDDTPPKKATKKTPPRRRKPDASKE